MLETFDFAVFCGSFRRASEPGAPLGQSGTTGRLSAAFAVAVSAKRKTAARAVHFMGNSGVYWRETDTDGSAAREASFHVFFSEGAISTAYVCDTARPLTRGL